MKLFIIPMLLVAVSCGKKTVIKKQYIENPWDNSGNDARFLDLENRVSALESQINNNVTQLQTLEDELTQLGVDQAQIISAAQSLSDTTNQLIVDLAELEANAISEIVDPCDKQAAFDEVLLKTGDNRVLAYFESGSRRYLSELKAGNYITTDGTNCHFSVDSNGNII